MKLIALDCEFNQPSGKLIEVGAVVFNSKTGKILDTFASYYNPEEAVSMEITALTGIDNSIVNHAPPCSQAYKDVLAFKNKHQANKLIVTWGQGDVESIFEQSGEDKNAFGPRVLDTKTLYQAMATTLDADMRAKIGLGRAIDNLGLGWDGVYGSPHRALADAFNTMRVYMRLTSYMRNGYKMHKDVL